MPGGPILQNPQNSHSCTCAPCSRCAAYPPSGRVFALWTTRGPSGDAGAAEGNVGRVPRAPEVHPFYLRCGFLPASDMLRRAACHEALGAGAAAVTGCGVTAAGGGCDAHATVAARRIHIAAGSREQRSHPKCRGSLDAPTS